MDALQPTLPGMGPGPLTGARRRVRRASYARVDSDPAVSAARARADHRFGEWRNALVRYLSGLPDARRRQIRRRLFGGARPAARPSAESRTSVDGRAA